jgi:transcriptional regulator with XRE-family HTH domain
MNAAALGLKFIELRKAAGLSQEELGRKAGVARGAVQQVEQGKGNPTLQTILSMGSVLNFDPFGYQTDGTTLSDLAKNEVKILQILERRLPEAQAIPPHLWAAWNGADDASRAIAMFWLTGEESHLEAPEISTEWRERLLRGTRFHKMKPKKKSRALKRSRVSKR